MYKNEIETLACCWAFFEQKETAQVSERRSEHISNYITH